jgi:hypothetical protein
MTFIADIVEKVCPRECAKFFRDLGVPAEEYVGGLRRAMSPGYERHLAFPEDCRSGLSPNGPDFVLHFQA